MVACALVATWWTGPSQRRLFSSVSISNNNYVRWMDGVVRPGSKTHLLKYVRSLQIWRFMNPLDRRPIRHLHRTSAVYFSAMPNIHSLEMVNILIEHIDERKFHTCFSAFRETLTHLTLENFDTSFYAFVTLVGYFPNMTTLRLDLFDVRPDERQVPQLSRPLRGKMHLGRSWGHYAYFFDRLAKLDPEYEELVLESRMETKLLESVLRLGVNTVRYLRLAAEFECEHPHETPSSLHFLTQTPTSSRNDGDDLSLSTTPRVGIDHKSYKFLSRGPPLLNHFYRAPQDHNTNAAEVLSGDYRTVAFGGRAVV